MKRISLLLALLALSLAATAAPVSLQRATLVANHFVQSRTGQPAAKAPAWNNQSALIGCSHLYLLTSTQGFVVVAGDDCVAPILAYSLEGNANSQPHTQIAWWLKGIDQAVEQCQQAKLTASEGIRAQWEALESGTATKGAAKGHDPMLTTHWSQSWPYNAYCPYDEADTAYAVTGCVATAMAQIMKYWNHPAMGRGYHAYTHPSYNTLSARFEHLYHWESMPDSLSVECSEEEIDAVARLISDCGVSCNMNYSPDGSGAISILYDGYRSGAGSLIEHFDYDGSTMHNLYRPYYSTDAWIDALADEIDEDRPMLFSGSDAEAGGHAFVCDGYDEDLLFHFNWGWNGGYDGFFSVDSMNPYIYQFLVSVTAVAGIQPNDRLDLVTHHTSAAQAGDTLLLTILPSSDTAHWRCSSNCGERWLHLIEDNGEGSRVPTLVHAVADPNPTGSERLATLIFTQGEESKLIEVHQTFCSDSEMCTLRVVLNDSYGDSWNDAALVLSSPNGFRYATLFSDSSLYSTERYVGICHTNVELTWIEGDCDNEQSYAIYNDADSLLLSVSYNDGLTIARTLENPCPAPEPVSILSAETPHFSAGPNPTDGRITVQGGEIRLIEVIDANGRVLMRSSDACVNLGSLPAGAYLMRINQSSILKIVKQ